MNTKRNVYLDMKSLPAARRIILDRFPMAEIGTEVIPAPESVGRVLAEPVFAAVSSPSFHAAAMDGIAVRAADTYGASEGQPRDLKEGETALFVNTGHAMPEGTDAVIMIEHIQLMGERRVRIEAPAYPWQHVRRMGEDIVATELLFPRNHRITPYCLGALLAGGAFQVTVRQKPRLLIIPTGSELVDHRRIAPEDLRPGQVIESNAYVLAGMTEARGGTSIHHPRLTDDLSAIREAVRKGVEDGYDAVLVIGGSSAGSEDYARSVIEDLGEILVHGVTIMPGKPAIVGAVANRPVFGIPGYPVSAIVAFEQLVAPLIHRALGEPEPARPTTEVFPTRKLPSKLGVEEFLRVKLGRVGDRIVATPLPRGAGAITTITEADGIIRVPDHIEGLPAHEPVTAELLRPLSAVERTLVAVGSHDNTLDILADELKATAGADGLTLSSSHVGSMGGLMALKRGVCHLAGSHLLDVTDGSYNRSYIRRYLPDLPVRVVHLVMRDQGLMVAPGNPRGIEGIEDLRREGIRFINRQGGSGTRILLDYRLAELGIDPTTIGGYDTEEFTHMSVAAAVLSGAADAGLGIRAAAQALGLDFIPVVIEQYDLIIPEVYFDTEPIGTLMTIIRSPAFQSRVMALGGYHVDRTGETDILDFRF